MTDKLPEDTDTQSSEKTSRGFDVFISHASEDRELARSLWGALSNRGIRCWFDEERLKPGVSWDQQLREAIDRSRMCLLLLSKASVPSKPWVSREWSLIRTSAWERDDLDIVPLLLDPVETPTFLRGWQSLRCDRQKPSIEKLVAAIIARLSSDRPVPEKEPENDRAEAVERFREILGALEQAESTDPVAEDKEPNE